MEGMRPVVEIMWADFMLVALDQLVNQAANVRYVTRAELSAPLVVRTQQGATPGSCAQHSQSLEALLAHIPGLRVGLAATPQRRLRDAPRRDRRARSLVILIEARTPLPEQGQRRRLGGERPSRWRACTAASGDDVAMLSWGDHRLAEVLRPPSALAGEGHRTRRWLDLRWLTPLDDDAIDRRGTSARAAS